MWGEKKDAGGLRDRECVYAQMRRRMHVIWEAGYISYEEEDGESECVCILI